MRYIEKTKKNYSNKPCLTHKHNLNILLVVLKKTVRKTVYYIHSIGYVFAELNHKKYDEEENNITLFSNKAISIIKIYKIVGL